MTSTMLAAIAKAWKGEPWEDVEILSGKVMGPSSDKKKTILFGRCIYQAHKNNPVIKEMIAIKGCPPKPEAVCEALHKAGIDVDPAIFKNLDTLPGFFLKRYEGKPEFDESFFKVE
jgi:Ni,Fe-hydrogenase III small subunit